MLKLTRLLLVSLCLGVSLMGASPAFACNTKKKSNDEVSIRGGSGETTRERERRLKRECRGRVNAGACEGYTH